MIKIIKNEATGENDIITEVQYSRLKGADWFPLAYKKDILVLGQGGIGSWVSLFLSRIGANLHIWDMDTFEELNMAGQMVQSDSIGKPKVMAVANTILSFSPDASVNAVQKEYTKEDYSNDIVICGFDNMKARKIAFENWVDHVNSLQNEEQKKNCFFQDGRLLAEHLQIFNISGEQTDRIEKYRKDYLFSDDEVEEVDCTFKQTTHCAAMIASHMTGFFTNWLSK